MLNQGTLAFLNVLFTDFNIFYVGHFHFSLFSEVGFEFDIKTGLRPFTDSRMRLRVYPARIADGQILISLGSLRAQEQTA